MRISDIAKEQGISKQAVYQRIKSNGIALDTLVQDKRTGELTAEGVAVISKLFVKKQASNIVTLKGTVNDKQKVIESLQMQIEKLTAENSMLKERISGLEKDKEHLQQMQRVMYVNSLPWYKRRKAEKQLLLMEDNSIKSDV